MAFPLTHLLVADLVLKRGAFDFEPGAFLLGSIAPDAVHFRAGFEGEKGGDFGAAKKVTHLCPISDEKWGQITDNAGWGECIREFLRAGENGKDSLCAGFAVHALTDIHNNVGIWNRFRTNHPEVAALGYDSGYYRDMKAIDIQIYYNLYKGRHIEGLLASATAKNMPGLVTAGEIRAIRDSLLYTQYRDVPAPSPLCNEVFTYVTYDEVLDYIDEAADYCAEFLRGS